MSSELGQSHSKIETHRAGKSLSIDYHGVQVGLNESILRLPDESEECMSEGFLNIDVEGNRITIHQQSCSRKALISEATTFEFRVAHQEFFLTEFMRTYHSRMEPGAEPKVIGFRPEDFGAIRFNTADLDLLYSIRPKLQKTQ